MFRIISWTLASFERPMLDVSGVGQRQRMADGKNKQKPWQSPHATASAVKLLRLLSSRRIETVRSVAQLLRDEKRDLRKQNESLWKGSISRKRSIQSLTESITRLRERNNQVLSENQLLEHQISLLRRTDPLLPKKEP